VQLVSELLGDAPMRCAHAFGRPVVYSVIFVFPKNS
jgi:hypothetical protein